MEMRLLHHHVERKLLFFLSVKGEMMDILNIRLKNMYKEFCSYELTPPTAKAKWKGKDPSLLCNWTKNILFAFSGFSGCIRAFQYRFFIVYTNDEQFVFKIVDSPYCTFCKNEVESPSFAK